MDTAAKVTRAIKSLLSGIIGNSTRTVRDGNHWVSTVRVAEVDWVTSSAMEALRNEGGEKLGMHTFADLESPEVGVIVVRTPVPGSDQEDIPEDVTAERIAAGALDRHLKDNVLLGKPTYLLCLDGAARKLVRVTSASPGWDQPWSMHFEDGYVQDFMPNPNSTHYQRFVLTSAPFTAEQMKRRADRVRADLWERCEGGVASALIYHFNRRQRDHARASEVMDLAARLGLAKPDPWGVTHLTLNGESLYFG